MLIRTRLLTTLLVGLLLSAQPALADSNDGAAPAAPPPAKPVQKMPPPPPLPPGNRPARPEADLPLLEKMGPGLFRLGDLTISKASESVSLPAVVNMDKGLLEYLLVRKGGKTHESLFRTDIDPTALQMALLLIGLEGTDRPLAHQGDAEAPHGNPVEITVSYLRDNKMVKISPENWISRKTEETFTDIGNLSWVFTGSIVRNQKFLAKIEGSIIALYHDPVALIDNASPDGENDKIWFVKEGSLPPVGTSVTITIQVKK